MNWCVWETVTKLLVEVKTMLHKELSRRGIDGVRALTQHPDIECLHFTVSLESATGGMLPLETGHTHGEDAVGGGNITL